MNRVPAVIASLAMALSTSVALALPAPPSGYSWYEVAEMKGGFLVPDGWHVRREESKGYLGTLAYYVTELPFEPSQRYLVGVNINIYLSMPSAPLQIEKALVDEAAKHSVEVERGGFGPFKTIQYQFRIPATPEHKTIQVVRLAVTNTKTNATYVLIFDTPADDWQRTWPIAEKILKMLALNDKV